MSVSLHRGLPPNRPRNARCRSCHTDHVWSTTGTHVEDPSSHPGIHYGAEAALLADSARPFGRRPGVTSWVGVACTRSSLDPVVVRLDGRSGWSTRMTGVTASGPDARLTENALWEHKRKIKECKRGPAHAYFWTLRNNLMSRNTFNDDLSRTRKGTFRPSTTSGTPSSAPASRTGSRSTPWPHEWVTPSRNPTYVQPPPQEPRRDAWGPCSRRDSVAEAGRRPPAALITA